MALSDRIAEARTAAGLTQTELARRLQIRPQSVQAWESGVSAPRARRLSEVANVLGVPEAYFFEEAKEGEGEGIEPVTSAAKAVANRLVALTESGRLDQRSVAAVGELIDLLSRKSG